MAAVRGPVRVQIVTTPGESVIGFANTVVPLLFLALFLHPPLRWAVLTRLERLAYAWRLADWRARWRRLPGWRQEVWNHARLPPEELRSAEPSWVKLG